MKLLLKDICSKFNISDSIFNYKFNESLVHQVIVSYISNARRNISLQKNRSTVSGSNRKPWKQKGTGRARAGTKKSPIWRSGGVTFTSNNKNYYKKINKKMYIGALKSIFSELFRKNRLLFVKKFFIDKPKTKFLLQKLQNFNLSNSVCIIDMLINKSLFLASRNLYNVCIDSILNINLNNLFIFDNIIMTIKAVKYFERIVK